MNLKHRDITDWKRCGQKRQNETEVQKSERPSCDWSRISQPRNRQFFQWHSATMNDWLCYIQSVDWCNDKTLYLLWSIQVGKINLLVCAAQVVRSSWSFYKILQNHWGKFSPVLLMIQRTFLKTFWTIIAHSRWPLLVLRLFMRKDLCLHIKSTCKCITVLDLYCHYQMKSLNFFNFILCLIWFNRLKRELMQLELQKLTEQEAARSASWKEQLYEKL